MSYSDNDNWIDDYDFNFSAFKSDSDYTGLELLSADDEMKMLQTDDFLSSPEFMNFDDDKLKYLDSFLNFPDDHSKNIPSEASLENTDSLPIIHEKQPSNQVIKNLLLKTPYKAPENLGGSQQDNNVLQINTQQQTTTQCNNNNYVYNNSNIFNNTSKPNNNESNNNVIVINPLSTSTNNNKKVHKIILNKNPVNLQLNNQPIVLSSIKNNSWSDQANQLPSNLSLANILSTQNNIKTTSNNKFDSNTLNNNNNVKLESSTNNNIKINTNNNNTQSFNLIANNNFDSSFNKSITFSIGPNYNNNTMKTLTTLTSNGGDKEVEVPTRSSHHSIEKRYRMSINDRIVELRELLAGKDSKLSKSAVLRKAIEYIRYMVAQNKRLKQENLAFKLAANSNKDFQSVLAAIRGSQMSDSIPSPPFSASSSPQFDDSSLPDSPLAPEESFFTNNKEVYKALNATPAAPVENNTINNNMLTNNNILNSNNNNRQHQGMLDRSRLILCIFLFTIFAFNPLSFFINILPSSSSSSSEIITNLHSPDRVLQSNDGLAENGVGGGWWDWWLVPVLPWVFNTIFMVAIFFKLFVIGEPLTKPMSASSLAYWRKRNEAEQLLFKKSYVEAGSHLSGCLVALGRPLPTTKFDLVASLLWNLTRQVLHRMSVGIWLEKLPSLFLKRVSLKDIQVSAKDAAVVYHKLLQLHMTEHLCQGTWGGINILLSALNMAEVAGEALPKETLAEIYTLVAMDIRMVLPNTFHFLARYFLTQARGICFSNCTIMPPSLTWLNHPLGHRFFVDAPWQVHVDKSLFTSCINEVDPLAHMLQNFRESLMEKATLALVTPGYRRSSNQTHQCQNQWVSNHSGDALRYLGLLNEVSAGFNNMTVIGYCQLNHLSNNIGVDTYSRWWFQVLTVAVHWLNEDLMAAESLYASVENVPCRLLACNNHLVRAVLLSFKARKHHLTNNSASSQSEEEEEGRVKGDNGLRRSHRLVCNKASELLRECIDANNQHTNKTNLAIQLLALDWLLVARTESWQRESCEESSESEGIEGRSSQARGCMIQPAMPSDLCHFQTDLASLRKLSTFIKAAMPKVFVHQATARLMAGASPFRSMQLYSKSLRKRNNTKNSHARYLPMNNTSNNKDNNINNTDAASNDNVNNYQMKDGGKNDRKNDGRNMDEGRDLKKFILCQKVVDEHEVAVVKPVCVSKREL